ncbi:MAG: uroporphyrinogen-III synthase [Acidimicrobiia bacterium]|nr:uroporphyrinogen-III synthase [Acidimicrobiia bacterium]
MSGPLSGYVIGVTADRRADEQVQLLTQRGAECLSGAVIRTHPLGPEEDLRRATAEVMRQPPEYVLLTTGIGVRGWLEAAEAMHVADGLLAVLNGARVFARGPKAAGAALTGGVEVTWSSPDATSAALVDRLAEEGIVGKRVAVQLDGALGAELSRAITQLGGVPVTVPVYRWSLPDDVGPAARLVRAVAEGRVDAITFTARPAVDNFFEIAAEIDLADRAMAALGTEVAVFCVGPVCGGHARSLGISPVHEPYRHRLGSMVQNLTSWFSGREQMLEMAGHSVRLQGRIVSVDGCEPVRLTERERGVLAALATNPGAVLSKRALLRAVWGGIEGDEHVVEVTVGRLRQRLGPAAVGIETVVRRGYRLSPL